MGRLDKFFSNLKESLKRGLAIGDEDQELLDKKDNEIGSRLIIPDITHNEEEKMIDQIAARIKKMNMETPAIMMLETFKPVNRLISQLYGFYAAPFFEIFGIRGYDYAAFFNKKKNLKILVNKLKENEEDN